MLMIKPRGLTNARQAVYYWPTFSALERYFIIFKELIYWDDPKKKIWKGNDLWIAFNRKKNITLNPKNIEGVYGGKGQGIEINEMEKVSTAKVWFFKIQWLIIKENTTNMNEKDVITRCYIKVYY
jgi:hypothetical protein